MNRTFPDVETEWSTAFDRAERKQVYEGLSVFKGNTRSKKRVENA